MGIVNSKEKFNSDYIDDLNYEHKQLHNNIKCFRMNPEKYKKILLEFIENKLEIQNINYYNKHFHPENVINFIKLLKPPRQCVEEFFKSIELMCHSDSNYLLDNNYLTLENTFTFIKMNNKQHILQLEQFDKMKDIFIKLYLKQKNEMEIYDIIYKYLTKEYLQPNYIKKFYELQFNLKELYERNGFQLSNQIYDYIIQSQSSIYFTSKIMILNINFLLDQKIYPSKQQILQFSYKRLISSELENLINISHVSLSEEDIIQLIGNNTDFQPQNIYFKTTKKIFQSQIRNGIIPEGNYDPPSDILYDNFSFHEIKSLEFLSNLLEKFDGKIKIDYQDFIKLKKCSSNHKELIFQIAVNQEIKFSRYDLYELIWDFFKIDLKYALFFENTKNILSKIRSYKILNKNYIYLKVLVETLTDGPREKTVKSRLGFY